MDVISRISFEIVDADKRQVTSEWDFHEFNPFGKLYYIGSGEGKVSIRGESITLRPGQLYFLPPYMPLDLTCEESMFHYWVHFTMDRPGEVAVMDLVGDRWEQSPQEPAQCPRSFECIIEAFRAERPRLQMEAQGHLRLLLSHFIPENVSIVNHELRDFLPTLKYIDDNLSADLSNVALANLHHWHPTYFANRFSKAMRISPRNYVIRRRIEAARKFLWSGQHSIAETAMEVGFRDTYYFAKVFRNLTGMPPGQYRDAARLNAP